MRAKCQRPRVWPLACLAGIRTAAHTAAVGETVRVEVVGGAPQLVVDGTALRARTF